MMLQFDDILLLFLNLTTKMCRNIHSGVAIICVKIKTKTGCGTLWVLGVGPIWYGIRKKIACGTKDNSAFAK